MPAPSPIISFRATGRLADDLAARAGAGALGGIVQRDLGRYYHAIDEALAGIRARLGLTRPEAMLIVAACNGVLWTETTAGLVWSRVADAIALQPLDHAPAARGEQLVARLRALAPFERLALVDAIERFWRRADPEREQDWAALLVEVGLLAPPAD